MKKLQHPDDHPKRIFPRATVLQAVHVRFTPQSEPTPGKLIDISESGARLETALYAKTELICEILWAPVPGTEPLNLTGKVVWVTEDTFGMHFEPLDLKTRSVLRSFVKFHRGD